ncbi:hypothetical protein NDU88_006476 [Pleurodeles waltl]|uniref:Uncharacterized protein n=1 Tax=Pleurodeles waltl TaxID=8319 RepID=A0AAV7WAR1_PLEWA|nr:hypothetical protein NDU88_006476 [Pleurodeles waltl]
MALYCRGLSLPPYSSVVVSFLVVLKGARHNRRLQSQMGGLGSGPQAEIGGQNKERQKGGGKIPRTAAVQGLLGGRRYPNDPSLIYPGYLNLGLTAQVTINQLALAANLRG